MPRSAKAGGRCFVALIGLIAVLHAHGVRADNGRWQATVGGCVVWNALPQLDETFEWSGICVAGKASGTGTEIDRFRDATGWHVERYVGTMRGGLRDGDGTQDYENGDRFQGRFSTNERVGFGVYTYANGDQYEGEFQRDHRTGHGSFTYHSGGRYEGEFRDGQFDGHGSFVFADGSRYEGEFRHGLPNGQGELHSAGGEVVAGDWSNGCLRQGARVAAAGRSRQSCGFDTN